MEKLKLKVIKESKNQKLKQEYKMIANFLGYVNIPFKNHKQIYKGWFWKNPLESNNSENKNNYYVCKRTLDLMFKYDYNKLFRIIDKIEDLGGRVFIDGNYCKIYYKSKTIESNDSSNKLHSIYNACVQFIYHYNSYNHVTD